MPSVQIRAAYAAYRHRGDPAAPVAFINHPAPRACGLLRNSAWPAKGKQPVAVMERAVLDFLSTSSESVSRQTLFALLHYVETALQPLAGFSKEFSEEDLWDLGGSLALLVPFDLQLNIVRVGDFRVVRIRDDQIDVLAREHTLRAKLERQGQPLPADAAIGNAIVAYLGGAAPIPEDAISTVDVQIGDRIAIFEHPANRPVEEDLAILSSVRNLSPEQSAAKAVDASNERAAARAQMASRAVGVIDIVE